MIQQFLHGDASAEGTRDAGSILVWEDPLV